MVKLLVTEFSDNFSYKKSCTNLRTKQGHRWLAG
jgi:hypothetical protein